MVMLVVCSGGVSGGGGGGARAGACLLLLRVRRRSILSVVHLLKDFKIIETTSTVLQGVVRAYQVQDRYHACTLLHSSIVTRTHIYIYIACSSSDAGGGDGSGGGGVRAGACLRLLCIRRTLAST